MRGNKAEALSRVLDVAAELFMSRPFADVSMAEVARLAHCSTATIYNAYESKEGVFVSALSRQLDPPIAPAYSAGKGLLGLLDYARAWLGEVCSPTSTALLRAGASHPDLLCYKFQEASLEARGEMAEALDVLLSDALEQGMIRPLDRSVITESFRAWIQCVPTMDRLMRPNTTPISDERLLYCLFHPLVTEAGSAVLLDYLQGLGSKG